MVKCIDILNKFNKDLKHISGDLEMGPLQPTSSIEHPKPQSVVFAPDLEKLKSALQSEASLIIMDAQLENELKNLPQTEKTLFSSQQLHVSMAQVTECFFTSAHYKKPFANISGIHPKACVAESAQLGKNVTVGPGACIDDHCKIGDNVYIGANCVIEAGCQIGEGSHLFPLVFLGHDTVVGKNCKIQSGSAIAADGFGYGTSKEGKHYFKPHLGRVVLGDHVDIGAGVNMDRGTFEDSVIGDGTKIDNSCHFGHNMVMGKHNLITGGFMAAGSVKMGSHCVTGGRTTVTGHITITDQVMVAGLSGVNKSVLKPGKYGGFPLQSLKESLKTLASLPHLPELRKILKKKSSPSS